MPLLSMNGIYAHTYPDPVFLVGVNSPPLGTCATSIRRISTFCFLASRKKNSMEEAKQCLLLTYEMQKNSTGRHFPKGEENKMSERVEDVQTTQHLFTTLAEVQLLLYLLFPGNWTSVIPIILLSIFANTGFGIYNQPIQPILIRLE